MSIEREFLKKLRYATHLENDLREELEELLIQPVREPEAWILENKKTGYRRQSAYKPTDLDEEACNVIPLYAALPTRDPLSDKEITKNTPKLIHIGERLAFHAGVRFAEKAHNIGGGE